MENEENKELNKPAERTEQTQGENKVIDDIQNRMNSMEVGKRKRIMILFIAVFILLSFFKMSTALKGCASDKETQMADTTQVVKGGAEDSAAILQKVLETPIAKERKRDPQLEEYMDKLVEDNNKEAENGKE